MRKTSENVFSSFKGSWRVSSSYFSKFALDHEQGFMPAVLMSCRRHKKLNFLIKFSNSIFIKFEVKVYWRWTCVQNKLIYKVSFYFQQFVCVPDVKKTKNVLRFYLTETPRRLRYEHVLELEAPRDPQPPLTPPPQLHFVIFLLTELSLENFLIVYTPGLSIFLKSRLELNVQKTVCKLVIMEMNIK